MTNRELHKGSVSFPMFVNRNSAGRVSFSQSRRPPGRLFKVPSASTALTENRCDLVSLKMQLSSVVTSPKLLLQLCISTLHCMLASLFSKVRRWTAGACKATTSPVSPAELDQSKVQHATTPTSVNYHFTRKCNYKCGFCFHTAKTSFVLPQGEAERGLKLLKESGKSDRSGYSSPGRSVQSIQRKYHTVKILYYKW